MRNVVKQESKRAEAAQLPTAVVDVVVEHKELAQNTASAAPKEHAPSGEEAKTAKQAERAKAKAERETVKAAKKAALAEARKKKKREKEDAKRAKADEAAQKVHELEVEIDAAATEVRRCDDSIKMHGRMSTAEVKTAGNCLIDIKPKLKLRRPKIGFKQWIEDVCRISYRAANNYMRVAEAIEKDPSLAEMILSDIYEVLGLVTRKRKERDDDTRDDGDKTGANAGTGSDDNEQNSEAKDGNDANSDEAGAQTDGGADAPPPRRPDAPVGPLTARWFGGAYLLELRGDWKAALHRALDDEQFETILRGPGVVLRLSDGADVVN